MLRNVTAVNAMLKTLLHLNMKEGVFMSTLSAVNVPENIVKVLKMTVNLLQMVKLIFLNNNKEANFIVTLNADLCDIRCVKCIIDN